RHLQFQEASYFLCHVSLLAAPPSLARLRRVRGADRLGAWRAPGESSHNDRAFALGLLCCGAWGEEPSTAVSTPWCAIATVGGKRAITAVHIPHRPGRRLFFATRRETSLEIWLRHPSFQFLHLAERELDRSLPPVDLDRDLDA